MTGGADDRARMSGDRRKRWTTWPAYAACAWMFVFAAAHLYWGLGGAVGLPPGLSLFDNTALFVIDLIAIPLNVLGGLFALALVRPWGRRFPQWMLLAASWGASALMVAHALPAIVEVVLLTLGLRAEELTAMDRFSMFLYEPYWLLGGILFGMAAWNYTRGTRRSGN